MGAAAQAARERPRSALAGPPQFTDVEHPELGAPSATPPANGSAQDQLAGRPARAAARRGCPGCCHSAAAHRSGDREPRRVTAPRRCRCTASRSRCRASGSSTSPGFSPRPAARGFSAPLARRASRSSGRTTPIRGWRRWRRSAAAPRANGDGAAARRQGPRHGRAIQQQEPGQAGHLAQCPAPEGLGDR